VADDKQQASGMRVTPRFPNGFVVPEFPELPEDLIGRFPSLKDWGRDIKKWRDELTVVLRNLK
jgi:hypothetical protein